jgi:hypothetical protein
MKRAAKEFPFAWNACADQPHNVAPRFERTRHHLRHWPAYFTLAGADLVWGIPALWRYPSFRRRMHRGRVSISPDMFGVAVSPAAGFPASAAEELASFLGEIGVRQTLFRVPSWEKDRLAEYEAFARALDKSGQGLLTAVLQRREDVFESGLWERFLGETIGRLGDVCPYFEVGHAWNRTKWGVWDYTEYLRLIRPAGPLRERYGVKIVGPAVIDFEFHLYPPVLRSFDFDKASSLLYVDRMGAPENAQAGWTTAGKIALLAAVVAASSRRPVGTWITEVNWPLEGTGPFSPASGKPNVSEDAQADYLVRYYVIALSSGLIERVYWWQLVAPGYGLIDSREAPWRRRPSFFAFQTMVGRLAGGEFLGKETSARGTAPAEVYRFAKDGRDFAVAWTTGAAREIEFDRPIDGALGRDGREVPFSGNRVLIDGSPRYIIF